MNELMEALETVRGVFYKPNGELNIIGMIVAAIVLFVVAHAVVGWISRLVTIYVQKREANNKKQGNTRRVKTLTNIMANLAKYGVYVVALMFFLDLCNINTSTILATAGVGSIAIAMGAQAVIKDFITGFFIIFDDQYRVGEYVECGGHEGYVETLGIRTTVIRDFDGSRHIIPNSEIRIVSNRGRGEKRAKVVIPIDRREDPDEVIRVFEEALSDLSKDYPDVKTDVWGVTGFVGNGYEVTVVGWDDAALQFDLEFDIRKCLISAMHKAGIQTPIPRLIRTEGDMEGISEEGLRGSTDL